MNFANFFIKRPIFASVLAIILTIIGASGRFRKEGRMEKGDSNVTGSLATSTQHKCVIGDVNVTAVLE